MKRDQYGRYLLPHPETGVEQAWTRATTIASTLSDRYALEQWAQRNIIHGIGLRPDLYALAAASKSDDKELLGKIAQQASEAAAASSSANLGTALHNLTERIDGGEILDVPSEWRADVDAYCQTLADNSVKIIPGHIEGVVVVPQIGAAGTFDRLVEVDGQRMVADLKTGANAITYGTAEIAIQLAIYARGTHLWTGDGYEPMPDDLDQDQALIIHLPVGTGTCTLHLVDISIGWFGVELALQVRDWRNRTDFSEPLSKWELKAVPTGTPENYIYGDLQKMATPTVPDKNMDNPDLDHAIYGDLQAAAQSGPDDW